MKKNILALTLLLVISHIPYAANARSRLNVLKNDDVPQFYVDTRMVSGTPEPSPEPIS